MFFSDVARERKMVQLWYEFLKEYRKSQRSPEEQHALYNSAVEQFSNEYGDIEGELSYFAKGVLHQTGCIKAYKRGL